MKPKNLKNHFRKYYQKLTQKDYTPLQHILSISAILLTPNTKKLVLLTLTMTVLTHIWKTRNRYQFDDRIIPTTNTITNTKNELKTIIEVHFQQHILNNTLDNFKAKFWINHALCQVTEDSLTILL